MQLTSEQLIFVVTNYLMTRSLKEIPRLFEQRFRDRVSQTKMTIWKIVMKYMTEGSSIYLNKDRSGRKRTEYQTEIMPGH